eukprot:TRINITY_DN12952_c0_g1_i1.p1 TRINITY_DN12952_c0_g1~~TRINITY_DN12952_c0_g1_i1.p1  ORF type:complete len:576 (+),score=156.50 TRINITY_DN12952_c0_g1_i1:1-1728(+)
MQTSAPSNEYDSSVSSIAPIRAVTVLRPETFQLTGRDALLSNVRAVTAVSDVVKTTLGPRSRLKLIADPRTDRYTLTNDGATVVNALTVSHPAATLLLAAARVQDVAAGDGTTSVVLCSGELLRQLATRLALRHNVNLRAVIEACHAAHHIAQEILRSLAVAYTTEHEELQRWMMLMAATALRTKHVALWRDLLARLAVDSMLQVTRVKSRGVRLDRDVTLVRVSGLDITCSFWSAGIMFRGDLKVTPRDLSMSDTSGQSRGWQHSRCHSEFSACLIADDLVHDSAVKSTPVSSVSMLTRVYNDTQESEYWQGVSDAITKLGITLILVSGEISPRGRAVLESRDCMAIDHVSHDALLRIASVTGVKVTSAKCLPRVTARHLTKVSNLGMYKTHAQTEQLFFVPHAAHASIVLCAATRELLQTVEIDLHDALRVLETSLRHEQLVLPGAGACEIEIAVKLSALAEQMTGLKREVFLSYIEALEVVPTVLATNAGVTPVNVIAKLRSEHRKGHRFAGVNGVTGEVVQDVLAAEIVEPFMVKHSVLQIATEVTCSIVSVDQLIIERSIIDKMLRPVTQ